MQFILLIDEVGAEFTFARVSRKEIVFAQGNRGVRLKPTSIHPLEVIQPTDKASRAAGGFVLLGPLGAALGVLSSKGPAVRFELPFPDGEVRYGLIEQGRYSQFRQRIEKLQTYRSGDLAKRTLTVIRAIFLALFCGMLMGPLGLLVGPAIIFGIRELLKSRTRGAARIAPLVGLLILLPGCATSPHDFPVPVMVDGEQANSMTGYMAMAEESVVRERLADRMHCPAGNEFLSLKTTRADNRMGTKILQYRAVMRCKAPA